MENPKKIHFAPVPPEAESAAKAVLDAAFRVHTALGPGLIESIYETCLAHELRKYGVQVDTQVFVPVIYDGIRMENGLRIDLLVDQCVIAEIKAVEQLTQLHEAQLLTYLKLTGLRLGLLINFNTRHLRDGIKRVVL